MSSAKMMRVAWRRFLAGIFGTPSSLVLTNATGLPLTTGVTGVLPVANGGTGVVGTLQTLTGAATILWNMASGTNAKITMDGNYTLGAPTNMTPGASGFLELTQGGGGNNTLAYNAAWLFPGGTDPTLSTANGAIDVLAYVVNSAGTALYAQLTKAYA